MTQFAFFKNQISITCIFYLQRHANHLDILFAVIKITETCEKSTVSHRYNFVKFPFAALNFFLILKNELSFRHFGNFNKAQKYRNEVLICRLFSPFSKPAEMTM